MTEGETARLDPRVPRDAVAHRHPAAAGLSDREHRRPARPGAGEFGPRDPAGRASRVPSRALLDTIAVDQALRPLGLVREDERSRSRASPAMPCTGLSPTPATPWSRSAPPARPNRCIARSAAAEAAGAPAPQETYSRLTALLRGGHSTDGEAAWLVRELEQAVRARAEIVVVVRMPGGDERALTLEATGLGGGSLRGRDRARRHRADPAGHEHRERARRRDPLTAGRAIGLGPRRSAGRIDPYG